MLYRVLKFFARLTVNGYFRSIYVKGKEHIPKEGPVIFVANHPSAFMDPILLGTEIHRKLYFLARGDIFKKQLAAVLFRMINMIPVYRKGETPGHAERNDRVFQKCFDHLSKGKSLMIFPEGNSKTERRLRPLKTGTARIALGAEALNNFSLNVTIVPIGINYSNPHDFRSDVFINFGEPINVSHYKELFLADEREGVNALMEGIKSDMVNLLVIVHDNRMDELVQQIELLYRGILREDMGPGDKGYQDFQLSKDIVMALAYHIDNDPQRVAKFQENIKAYMNGLKELDLRDTHMRKSRLNIGVLRSLFYFVMGFPLFLFGYSTNYIPYRLAGWVSSAIRLPKDFVGSIKIVAGMFIFLIIYALEVLVIGRFTDGLWWLLFGVSLYPAGLFTVNYLKKYYRVIDTWKYLRIFIQKSDLVAKLKLTRLKLMDELEVAKNEYLLSKELS